MSPEAKDLCRKGHQTIKKVTDDIEDSFHFNTAISAVMELVNAMYSAELETDDAGMKAVAAFCIENVVLLLSPIVPHVAEELWQHMGHTSSIVQHPWPQYREDALVSDEMTIVVQVNGKLRSKFTIGTDADDDALKAVALADAAVEKHIAGKTIRKVIVVKKKLVNVVV